VIDSIHVIGARGRVGSTLSARLSDRGIRLDAASPELVLLCVPDRAIGQVASEIAAGPWVAHVSGATPLSALEPHERRFSMHPLVSITHDRGPAQLDGGWCAVTAESADALGLGFWLAETLGLRPFQLADEKRAVYHAAAAIASNYLVTLRETAGSLLASAGAPTMALDPLMRSVIENGYELTGPIARGDWKTVARHLDAIRETRPELEDVYVALARATAEIAGRELPRDSVALGAGSNS
jgi:predicted short-subunit dehydrogenase-like oxidoreductase (DUF2520 family)